MEEVKQRRDIKCSVRGRLWCADNGWEEGQVGAWDDSQFRQAGGGR